MEDFPTYKIQRKPKRNLMPPPPYCRKFDQLCADNGKSESKALRTLEISDPGEILLLLESLSDTNTIQLEKKINYYVQEALSAKTVYIISMALSTNEAVVQVIGQDALNPEFRITLSNCFFMDPVERKQTVSHYLYEYDPTLAGIVESYIGQIKAAECEIVTVPVIKSSTNANLPVLVCVVNSPKSFEFITKFVNETYRFCLPILINTSKFEEETRIKKQCQSLLSVARRLFGHLGDLHDLLTEIMLEARRLTNSERCSLFLLDPDQVHLVAKVFDGGADSDVVSPTEVVINIDQGIAGHVVATGKLLNIKNAYEHPLFYKGMDEATGFRTRNILCFPIRDENGIVGVAQLCNKISGDFDFFDEEVALAFSIYCGISIMHSIVYKKIQEAQHRSKLSNELMLYHMKVSQDDVNKVLLCTNRHDHLDYDMFHFSPKRIRPSETLCQILRMFEDVKLFENIHMDRNVVVRFLLYVKRGYRDSTPYHNWTHAFSTVHFSYVAVKQLRLIEKGYLTLTEALAYMVSCICHDIDHRGTTNSFQLKAQSVLASLYSSEGSVMEHHHFSQTMCILNTEDCNFINCFSNEEYKNFIALVKDLILATDLANHFALMPQQEQMVAEGYQPNNPSHKHQFLSLLMTCADLSDQIKSWDVVKMVAKQIYEEFFEQGDLEKSMGAKPSEMMDREQANIPILQLDFLERVCSPAFMKLQGLFPDHNVTPNLERNRTYWEACKTVFGTLKQDHGTPLDLLMSDELDVEIKKLLGIEDEENIDDSLKGADSEVVVNTIEATNDENY